jgi:hypothetical protein
MKTNANTTDATFAPDSLTIGGTTYPAQYSVTTTGTVFAFLTVQEDGKPADLRIKITPSDAVYADALAAAQTQKRPETVSADESAAQPEPITQPEPVQATEPAAPEIVGPVQATPAPDAQETAQPEPVPETTTAQPAQSSAPEKHFIGQTIQGTGWRIIFDGDAGRTRVIVQDNAPDAVREAVQAAGFYWSKNLESYNKKLTFRAYRAAQALAQQLRALPA